MQRRHANDTCIPTRNEQVSYVPRFGDSNSNQPGCSTAKSSRSAPGALTVTFGLLDDKLPKLENDAAGVGVHTVGTGTV